VTISRDTIACISIAERPGNLGATIFNSAFKEMALDYVYKPFKVEVKDLKKAILGIRALGIRGCGVSMPHKVKVIQHLDAVDKTARKIGAVNTIINKGGVLKGYNTDFEGARIITKKDYNVRGADVFIAGAGGAAMAIVQALKENKAKNIFITNRDEQRGKKFAKKFGISYIPWKNKDELTGEMLINATPLGMKKDDSCIFSDKTISNFKTVLDVVVSPHETHLIKKAKKLKKVALPGIRMASLQGMVQFKLYTGLDIPIKMIEKSMNNYLNNN